MSPDSRRSSDDQWIDAPDGSGISHVVYDECEHVGHEWADAGGGLLICMVCQAEMWGDPRD